MKLNLLAISSLLSICSAAAQTEAQDSIRTKELGEVVVEAQMQSTSSTVSTYIPTSKQKNASQTGTDLLNRMAIPQLSLGMGNSVQTATGKPVDIFIDYLPASEQDLTGMRMADVRKVEYYDYPDDPRFQGKAHVVNFIMHKYEYGGYFKASGHEFFIANSGSLNLFSKLQYKRMTFDLAVGGYYNNSSHNFSNLAETYRLPQPDGTTLQFERFSTTHQAKLKRRYFWPTFKALYRTDKITISNTVGATFDNRPTQNSSGSVYFAPADFPQTDFISEGSRREDYVTYSGYWNFILPHGNVINFNPYYSYSHNRQNSRYIETDAPEYINLATDNSHRATGRLTFQHDFGKWGDITVMFQAIYTNNRTYYSGTANTSEKLTTLRIGPGVSYNYTSDKLYGMVGAGFTYDRSSLGDESEKNTQPWVDVALQYAFNDKNSLNAEFHHMNSLPQLSYRSAAVIQSNPLMSYTGNPNLTPYKSYDFGVSYLWLPNNRFRFSVFGTAYVATNRFAYVYEASPTGILRTVQQPLGRFAQGSYGLNGTATFFNGKLQVSGQVAHLIAKSGEPYDWTKSHANWYLQAFYYLDNWHFGLQYQSDMSSADGFVKGTWVNSKNACTAMAGWGNAAWNLQAMLANPFRWNWRTGTTVMTSANYDFTQDTYGINNHCYVYVSATYTFGFGKKIAVGNEVSQQSGAGSAILN